MNKATDSQPSSKKACKRQRKEGFFLAKDGFGHTHRIEVYVEVLPTGGDGPRTYLTTDGESVERVGKGQFRIVHGGLDQDLRSDDPAAL